MKKAAPNGTATMIVNETSEPPSISARPEALTMTRGSLLLANVAVFWLGLRTGRSQSSQ